MARFNNFTTLITNNNSNENEDEEDKNNEFERDNNIEENINEGDTHTNQSPQKTRSPMKAEVGQIPVQEPLQEEYLDNSYWKLDHLGTTGSIDDLLKEMKYE